MRMGIYLIIHTYIIISYYLPNVPNVKNKVH